MGVVTSYVILECSVVPWYLDGYGGVLMSLLKDYTIYPIEQPYWFEMVEMQRSFGMVVSLFCSLCGV
jgi:hypothetical protein